MSRLRGVEGDGAQLRLAATPTGVLGYETKNGVFGSFF